MGRTSPLVLRSGHLFNNWKSHWFSDNNYTSLLTEDLKIRYYINNVHYYLKLPSSDLRIKRSQNQTSLMHNSIYLPEYLRVDKLSPFKFHFFRLNNNLIVNGDFNTSLNHRQTEASLTIILLNAVVKGNNFSCSQVRLIKSFFYNKLLTTLNVCKLGSKPLDLLYGAHLDMHRVLLINYKMIINLGFFISSFFSTLKFEKNIHDKLFNKKYNLNNLFELFSGEDILFRDYARGSQGKNIIHQAKRKSYTAASIVLSDSFGKLYRYTPQTSKRKYPFYDFIHFYKLNFIYLLKVYTNYLIYKKKKRKRRLTSKKLKKRYFVRHTHKVLDNIAYLKIALSKLVSVYNNAKYMYRDTSIQLLTDLNKYNYNNNNLKSIYNKKVTVKSLITHYIYNLLIRKVSKRTRSKFPYISYINKYIKPSKLTKRRNIQVKGLLSHFKMTKRNFKNNSKPSTINMKKSIYIKLVVSLIQKLRRNKTLWSNQISLGKSYVKIPGELSSLLKFNKSKNDTYVLHTNPTYGVFKLYKENHINVVRLKRKVYEILDYYWTKLGVLYKLVVSKFRKVKILRKNYYSKFKKTHYLLPSLSNKWVLDVTTKNLNSSSNPIPFSSMNQYISDFHPIYSWINELINVKYAYRNKQTNLNRYYLNQRPSLKRLSKASYYYIKLRRRKRRRIDRFDIRYIPRGWHKKTYQNKQIDLSLNNSKTKNKKQIKQYIHSMQLSSRYSYKHYTRLQNRLLGTRKSLSYYKQYKLKLLECIPTSSKLKIKKKLILRTIIKYIQKLLRVKKTVTSHYIQLMKELRTKGRRGFKARERKLRHLYYIRLLGNTIRNNYPIYLKTVLFLIKPYITKRFNKARRNPELFYKNKKRKLPIGGPLYKFKQKISKKVQDYHNKKKRYNQWKWSKYTRKYKSKYHFKNRFKPRSRYKLSKFDHNILMKKYRRKMHQLVQYKKVLLDSLNYQHNYKYNSFKSKLMNLFIVNNNARFILLQRNSRILSKYLRILKYLSKKQFFSNLHLLKRGRFRLTGKIKNTLDYLTIDPVRLDHINYISDSKNQSKKELMRRSLYRNKPPIDDKNISTKVVFKYLYKYLLPISNNIIIQKIISSLKMQRVPLNKKQVSTYLMLIILKTIIQNSITAKNYQLLTKLGTYTKDFKHNTNKDFNINSFSDVMYSYHSKSKLYRSYLNYKLRSKLSLLRTRYHYKHLMRYLSRSENRLSYNLSFIKLIISKVSNHLSHLLSNIRNSNLQLKRVRYHKTSSNMVNVSTKTTTSNLSLKETGDSYNSFFRSISKSPRKRYKSYTKVLKMLPKLMDGLCVFNKRTIYNFLRPRYFINEIVNTSNKAHYLCNQENKFKLFTDNLLFLLMKSSIYSNINFKDTESLSYTRLKTLIIRKKRNKLGFMKFKELRKHKLSQRNKILLNKQYKYYLKDEELLLNSKRNPMSHDIIKFKHILYSNIKNKQFKQRRRSLRYNRKSSYFVFNKTSIYKYKNNILAIIKYIYSLSIMFNQSFNHLKTQFNNYVTILNKTKRVDYSAYVKNYNYMYQIHYFVVNILKSILNTFNNYIHSNLYNNISNYVQSTLLNKSFNVYCGQVTHYKYTWKPYTYFTISGKSIFDTFKKSYGENLTSLTRNVKPIEIFNSNTQVEFSNFDSKNSSLTSLYNIGSYMNEEILNYIQLNYVMEYDTNKLVQSKENFLYFYNLYTYSYDYNCMFILNPRLLCDYFVYAIKNKVQYYEIYGDIREAFGDLRRLQINLKKIYDRVLYRFLHSYLDILVDWHYIKLKKVKYNNLEYTLFLKKLKRLSTLFSYLIYLVEVRNYINICGLHIKTGGRRSRKLRTHTRLYQRGKMSLNTFSDDIDYYFKPVMSRFGTLGTKVFIYREPCFRIPLLKIMYQTLFLRFRLLRNLLVETVATNAKR